MDRLLVQCLKKFFTKTIVLLIGSILFCENVFSFTEFYRHVYRAKRWTFGLSLHQGYYRSQGSASVFQNAVFERFPANITDFESVGKNFHISKFFSHEFSWGFNYYMIESHDTNNFTVQSGADVTNDINVKSHFISPFYFNYFLTTSTYIRFAPGLLIERVKVSPNHEITDDSLQFDFTATGGALLLGMGSEFWIVGNVIFSFGVQAMLARSVNFDSNDITDIFYERTDRSVFDRVMQNYSFFLGVDILL